jgi:hypothetical protein
MMAWDLVITDQVDVAEMQHTRHTPEDILFGH